MKKVFSLIIFSLVAGLSVSTHAEDATLEIGNTPFAQNEENPNIVERNISTTEDISTQRIYLLISRDDSGSGLTGYLTGDFENGYVLETLSGSSVVEVNGHLVGTIHNKLTGGMKNQGGSSNGVITITGNASSGSESEYLIVNNGLIASENGHAISIRDGAQASGGIHNTEAISAGLNGIEVVGTGTRLNGDIFNEQSYDDDLLGGNGGFTLATISGQNGIVVGEGASVAGNIVHNGSITATSTGILIAGTVEEDLNIAVDLGTSDGAISAQGDAIHITETGSVNDIRVMNGNIKTPNGYGLRIDGQVSGDIYSAVTFGGWMFYPSEGGVVFGETASFDGDFYNYGHLAGDNAFVNKTSRPITIINGVIYEGDEVYENTGLITGTMIGMVNIDNSAEYRPAHGSVLNGDYIGRTGSILGTYSLRPDSDNLDVPYLTVTGKATFEEGSTFKLGGDYGLFVDGGVEYIALQAGELEDNGVEFETFETLVLDTTVDEESGTITASIKRADDTSVQAEEGGATEVESINLGGVEDLAVDAVKSGTAAEQESAKDFLDMLAGLETNADVAHFSSQLLPDVNGASVAAADISAASSNTNVMERTSELRAEASGETGVNTGDSYSPRHGLWIQAVKQGAEQDDHGGVSGFDANAKGFTLGYDVAYDDSLTIGAATTYSNLEVITNTSNDSVETESYLLSLYGSYLRDQSFVDAVLHYGHTKNESGRYISDTLAKADFDGSLAGFSVLGGHSFFVGNDFILTPQAAFLYNQSRIDSYSEKDSPAAINVKSQSYESIELGLGVGLSKVFEVSNGLLIPELNLMAYRDFADDEIRVSYNYGFAPDDILSAEGLNVSPERYTASFDVDYEHGLWLVTGSYGITMQPGYKSNTAGLQVRYSF